MLCGIAIPVLLASVSLKTYLSSFMLVALAVLAYLWTIEKLAPLDPQTRRRVPLGLLQVYPHSKIPASTTEDTGGTETA